MVTLPGSAVPAIRRCLPTQRCRSGRGCHPTSAAGLGTSSPPCSLFPSSATQKEKKKKFKKKRKQFRAFCKSAKVTQGGHPSPPGRKDFQRVLGPCLAALSPGSPPDPDAAQGRRPSSSWSPSTRRPFPQAPMLVVRGLRAVWGLWGSGSAVGASGWEEAHGPLALAGCPG